MIQRFQRRPDSRLTGTGHRPPTDAVGIQDADELAMDALTSGRIDAHDAVGDPVDVGLAHERGRITALAIDRGGEQAGIVEDRKSTRLNSSHVKISYA